MLLAFFVLGLASPPPVRADAVVGTGTAASCTESALDGALAAGGNVTFNCGGATTITVTSTKTISADTTIDGRSLITISGGNSVRVFSVNTGVNFTVQNLTIANGGGNADGAGIFNLGTLTVTNSTFSGNRGSGSSHGGGIYNTGTVTVTNSTFSGNRGSGSSHGGGIYNTGTGTATVTNSTFSGNSARDGGGIYNDSGTVSVTNTIIANSASGGNCVGSVTDGGHNIDDGTTCGFTGTGCTTTTGTSFCNTNPVLDPTGLKNNGGPTQTVALCTGTGAPSAGCTGASPGINAGNESVCSTTTGTAPVDNLDQRGYVRPGAGATKCSIGAFEANSAAPTATSTQTATPTPTPSATSTTTLTRTRTPTVTATSTQTATPTPTPSATSTPTLTRTRTPTPTVTATSATATPTPTPSATSTPTLTRTRTPTVTVTSATATPTPTRAPACVVGTGTGASCTEAALNACLPGGGSFAGTVTFNCGGATTITVTSTKTISADTTIDGGSLITISGGNGVGVFSVNTGVKFTVQNLTIANGNSVFGGGIFSGGTLSVTNSTFSGNSASADGGGMFISGGTLTVTNSTFSGNSAGGGGGIYNNSGTLTVTNSTFSGNSASVGSGMFISGGTLTVTNSTFSGNSASIGGGGIYNDSGTVTVTNTILANSTAGGNCAGSVSDGGHNIDDGTTCGLTGTGCTSSSGSSFCNTNPHFDPAGLANNGGPTQTIALQAGSPAVNAGNESVCAVPPVSNLDQRSYVRPGAGATKCSIGAFEYNSPAPPLPCVGDCNSDRQVTVDEILTMVNIALGNADVSACMAGDVNKDGEITVDEILTAVNNALNGCPK